MSDVAALRHLRPASARLPLAWYFDPEIFALEKKRVLEPGPNYAGHELMVPAPGDYRTLAQRDHAKMLVRNDAGVELLSNVCRHRQSIMLEGSGRAENIVCPLHRWTYDLRGRLLGAPHFGESPCLGLESSPLTSWRGLLFAGPRDPHAELAGLPVASDFDFSGYRLDRVLIEDHPVNWKIFLELYLELYHVEPYHQGLSNYADLGNFRIEYGENWSVQIMGAKAGLGAPGTPAYREWQRACLERLDGRPPKQAALWMTYYPDVMLEWYPNARVVSTLVPRAPELTRNVVEFYYPEEIALFERDFVEAHQAAYLETAAEDGELCARVARGRRALYAEGKDDSGPYQSPMEDTMLHFHEWLHARLGQAAAGPVT
jgi:choline monooxygenase